MSWQAHARSLADLVTHPGSRWYPVLVSTPRHEFVPAWWEWEDGGWVLRRGPVADVYSNQSLVTRVGTRHADQAADGDRPVGRPTSSSTMPSLLLTMYRHGQLDAGQSILDVGTGSGYGAALLARRYGAERITTVDIDPYLVAAASKRLAGLGLHPTALTVDATGPLPGQFDRIVSTVSVRSIPPSWLAALRPGGRLVTTITGTYMILAVTRGRDGLTGQVAWEPAAFMGTRTGPDYPADVDADLFEQDGEQISIGCYPVLNVAEAWELATLFTLAVPGVRHAYRRGPDGQHTAVIVHPDGSWARATAVGAEPPIVHQTGPRRLWDELDAVRDQWLRYGAAPYLGACVRVDEEGTVELTYGDWRAVIRPDCWRADPGGLTGA